MHSHQKMKLFEKDLEVCIIGVDIAFQENVSLGVHCEVSSQAHCLSLPAASESGRRNLSYHVILLASMLLTLLLMC